MYVLQREGDSAAGEGHGLIHEWSDTLGEEAETDAVKLVGYSFAAESAARLMVAIQSKASEGSATVSATDQSASTRLVLGRSGG